jgi:23S rRNA (uridine2552-2'-O)-methyltransferase
MGDRRQDHYARRAKQEGRPARSVYKLEEIDHKVKLFRPGQRVLDLGASPGSWTQYAAEAVGPHGRVVAFDLKPLELKLPDNVSFAVGDIFELCQGSGPLAPGSALGTFDLIISDMAPSTMGHHKTDALRSAVLCEQALFVAQHFGRVDGHVVIKALEGGEVPQLANTMRAAYKKVTRLRPQATRKESTEIFLIGLNKREAPGKSE